MTSNASKLASVTSTMSRLSAIYAERPVATMFTRRLGAATKRTSSKKHVLSGQGGASISAVSISKSRRNSFLGQTADCTDSNGHERCSSGNFHPFCLCWRRHLGRYSPQCSVPRYSRRHLSTPRRRRSDSSMVSSLILRSGKRYTGLVEHPTRLSGPVVTWVIAFILIHGMIRMYLPDSRSEHSDGSP